jgi:SAM-dependent methyltransferase
MAAERVGGGADRAMKELWDASFQEQIQAHAYNTAPAEAIARNVAYYLRDRQTAGLRFLEMGCGAGPNLIWLAERGIEVTGVDISPTALELARRNLERAGYGHMVTALREAPVSSLPFDDESFDGIIESCVFQHLPRPERSRAFMEVGRLLKKGGLFAGYMLGEGHSVFASPRGEQLADDPGTVMLADPRSKVYLTGIGLSHFFAAGEFAALLEGFSIVDPCLTTYYLPRSEARKRGYDQYLQSMWAVYAVK